jgi:hypothetical protein
MKLTYEPIEDYNDEPVTKADLYNLYEKIQSLYEDNKLPETVIQINQEN